MFISVVIPTYNRFPILKKCLYALEKQQLSSRIDRYEVIVVDDGSTDGTKEYLSKNKDEFPHVELILQNHLGAGAARNNGVSRANGDVIVFIDSDLVVTESFLNYHAKFLIDSWKTSNNKLCFTYGSVINTANFENPTIEPYKFSDISWAYFATGNVAIDKNVLKASGLFDPEFRLYGWEDLELGERLRLMGVKLIKCPKAKGYHWHPAFSTEQIPHLIRVEKERAKMGLTFFLKHPSLRVRLMIQFTFVHRILWEILTIFGIINTSRIKPVLDLLVKNGYASIANEILRIPLNLICVREIFKEAAKKGIH